MSNKRKWLASEEDRFIDIWVHNLHLFTPGKRLMETYTEMEPYFREVGIEISAQGIKSKMETLKRKYFNLLEREDPSTTWRHFDTMAIVVAGTSKEVKDLEWKDYTQPSKTTHISRTSVYLDDRAQSQSESEGPFNTVYLEECAGHFFNDEEKPKAKKKRQRFSNTSRVQAKSRKVWQPAEENVFVDVWEKFACHIHSDRKKMDVYKDMQNELQQRGLNILPGDIKSKIESLTRSFRTQRDTVGDKSEWIHYSKIAQILSPLDLPKFEPFPDPSSCSSEDDSAWFKEMEPKSNPDHINNFSSSHDNVVNNFEVNAQLGSSVSSIDYSLIDPDPRNCKVSIEILEQDDKIKPLGNIPLDKKKSAEEFSQFVTKELAVLNDDLLIEAKRQIYNIICVLQKKQNNVSKN
ncbi:uncharacterized protein LOC108095672 isoform X2 [Drosophila ficusphila]|uniref:uncharacterized protein LOC108095672 isoform X2 n=1 Tax=Drosophila ficusphila TaxID=30025 RepID=UPI0007E812EE|nr:uncharacterized protein LOC108095672 isoform X2 [Drosophila ficusphila]